MATATFWQRGETLDYTNSTEADIPANTVVVIGDRIGVTGCDIPAGQTGSVHMTGVFEIKKTGEAAIDMGKKVYFDGTGITDTSDSATPAGYAAAAADASAEVVQVQIGA